VSTSLGHLLTLSIGAPAAGGTFVARHDGRVVFVRGTAPGETVVARLVDDPVGAKDARFWRAETLEVLEPSVDRVPSVWPEAGTDGVGGAEWAHIALPAQRRLATEVLQELLGRARVRSFPLEEVQVEPAPHDVDGLGSRSRVHFAVDDAGKPGMRGWRSREVRGVGENPLAATAIRDLPLTGLTLPAGTDGMDAVAPSLGRPAVVVHGKALEPVGALARTLGELAERADVALSTARGILPITGDGLVREQVGERVFTVGAAGFWQVHPQAATLLADVVRSDLDAQAGDRIWDLYGGVGLFRCPDRLGRG
jgi:tRNA/tmRNA/rRNA uracil-C5-methylase (TrmA/RlmC/RlmD family)